MRQLWNGPENFYMAVSIKWRGSFWWVKEPYHFGVYIKAPDCWKLTFLVSQRDLDATQGL